MKFSRHHVAALSILILSSCARKLVIRWEIKRLHDTFYPGGADQRACTVVHLSCPQFSGYLANALNDLVLNTLCLKSVEELPCKSIECIAEDFIHDYRTFQSEFSGTHPGWELNQSIRIISETPKVLVLVHVLGVRTEGEYLFVGHAPMTVNVPLKCLVGVNAEGKPLMKQNEKFVEVVKAKLDPTDILLIMWRSDGRSAAAVNLLAEHGFTNAYGIYDGFEDDMLKKDDSYNNDKRVLNDWKNSDAPWTYDVDTKLVYIVVDVQ